MDQGEDGVPIKEEHHTTVSQLLPTQSSLARRKRDMPRQSWTVWYFSFIARCAVWYTVYAIVFSCPSNPQDLSGSHSVVCKPYYATKSVVAPYIEPYYETYASPYVEKVRPYADNANQRVINPAKVFAIANYDKYAAPQVARAVEYTFSEWEKRASPRLQQAQQAAQQVYDENLAPHIQKASDVATPYYETARDNAFNVHERHIVPAIAISQPHIHNLYTKAQKFVAEKVVPSIQYAWTNLTIFVDGTLWPFIKRIYARNVRPQLVMIGERIAKYQEGRKLQSAMQEVDASVSTSTTPQASTPVTSGTTTTSIAITTSVIESSPSTVAQASKESRIATDETITEDLVKWQKRFAVAADKGTDDLKERIEEIVSSITKSDLAEGEGLALALEKTCEVELGTMKTKINNVVATLPADADRSIIDAAEHEIVQAIRTAGTHIKDRAKNVRAWTDGFNKDLKQRTELVTDSTLQVLDDIRDLGLQEIGMRWAWMEGVSYKHWQKYHDLKRKFAEWRSEVRETALSDPAIEHARERADQILEESMAATETAAKELIRLKDVARWKIALRDSTNDFETRAIPIAAAVVAASSMAGDVKQAIIGSSQGTIESLASLATEQLQVASDSASSVVIGTTGSAEAVASSASSVASTLADRASSLILGTAGHADTASRASSSAKSALSGASSQATSRLSEASAAATDALSEASAAVIGSSTGSAESLSSVLSNEASSRLSKISDTASSLAHAATTGPSEGIVSSASSFADSLSSSASSAVVSASASERLQAAVANAGENVTGFTSSLTAGQ